MEDERLFLHFFVSSMEDGRFFSVHPLSTMVEAPRPFGFLVSGGLAFYAFVISSISHMFITSNVFVVSRIMPKKWTFKK